MIGRTAIAAFADHVLHAEAFAAVAVAMFHAAVVAHAAPAIFPFHRVAEIAGRAQIACFAVGIVQTLQALTGDGVTRVDLIGVYVTRTLAWLAIVTVRLGAAIVAGGAYLATGAVVSRQTVATDLVAFVVHLAAGGKVVGDNRQRTRADQTVRRCTYGGVAIVALLAELAVVASGAVFAVLRDNRKTGNV